jgi:hypothetical protein
MILWIRIRIRIDLNFWIRIHNSASTVTKQKLFWTGFFSWTPPPYRRRQEWEAWTTEEAHRRRCGLDQRRRRRRTSAGPDHDSWWSESCCWDRPLLLHLLWINQNGGFVLGAGFLKTKKMGGRRCHLMLKERWHLFSFFFFFYKSRHRFCRLAGSGRFGVGKNNKIRNKYSNMMYRYSHRRFWEK